MHPQNRQQWEILIPGISNKNLKITSEIGDWKQSSAGRWSPKITTFSISLKWPREFVFFKIWYTKGLDHRKLTSREAPNRIVEYRNSPNMIFGLLHIKLAPREVSGARKEDILPSTSTNENGVSFIGIWSVKEDIQCKEQCDSNGLSGQSTNGPMVRISLSKDMTRNLSPLLLVRDLGGEDLPHKKRWKKWTVRSSRVGTFAQAGLGNSLNALKISYDLRKPFEI